MIPDDYEGSSFDLVRLAHSELAYTLASLTEESTDVVVKYKSINAKHLAEIVSGYILLRSSGQLITSKIVIRPIFELFIKILAVTKDPTLLLRLAHKERDDDRKWADGLSKIDFARVQVDVGSDMQKLKQICETAHPELVWEAKSLDIAGLMEKIEWEHQYQTHYRPLCRYSHCSYKAVVGGLADMAPLDNSTVVVCALGSAEILESIGGKLRNVQGLYNQLSQLTQPKS